MFLKKIIISFIIFFLGVGSVFATYDINNTDGVTNNNDSKGVNTDTTNAGNLPGDKNGIIGKNSSSPQFTCEPGEDGKAGICSDQFKIDTKLFSPGGTDLNKPSTKETVKGFFEKLIQKLMIGLGSLALIVMVVGAGFMIVAMGKDDNLNKGKTIFKAGIIALVLALSSYYMVSFLSYILYTTGN